LLQYGFTDAWVADDKESAHDEKGGQTCHFVVGGVCPYGGNRPYDFAYDFLERQDVWEQGGQRLQCHAKRRRIRQILQEMVDGHGMRLEEGCKGAELLRLGGDTAAIISIGTGGGGSEELTFCRQHFP